MGALNEGFVSILYKILIRSTLFILVLVSVWLLYIDTQKEVLTVSFLDVGQGDSIFIETPRGVQVLIDAGANAGVLRQLQKEMSFYDRSIDMLIATHPDKDHIGGMPDVIKRFKVGAYMESSIGSSNSTYDYLHKKLEEKRIQKIFVAEPQTLFIDDVKFHILFPDRSVDGIETNTGSLVMQVVYGDHEFLLTGDSPKSIERYLVRQHGDKLQSDVLKVGHHGSKTSSDETFVETVSPEYAVISAGKDNRYGHPHQDVLKVFSARGINMHSTVQDGTVVFRTDGINLIKE